MPDVSRLNSTVQESVTVDFEAGFDTEYQEKISERPVEPQLGIPIETIYKRKQMKGVTVKTPSKAYAPSTKSVKMIKRLFDQ